MANPTHRTLAVVCWLCLFTACNPQPQAIAHVPVVARDYAFGAPRRVPPGPTAFHLINEGTVIHEVQIYRFRPGITPDSAMHLLASDNLPDSAIDVDGGVLIAGPRDSALQQLLVPLQVGDVYALECAFRNAPDQPKHRELGMISVFEVR